jgi:pimeloyl-ACP methyl ester carboxylesterase
VTQDFFVTSKDGTEVHVCVAGSGPGVILVHGGLQTSDSLSQLAALLSDSFTVYRVDRRGRGPSGPFGNTYGLQTEIDDLGAVVAKTGAAYVFGLSSGALIILRTALDCPAITRIALYEPPMEIAGARVSPFDWVPAYEKRMTTGNLAGALAAILKGVDDPSLMTLMPQFLLEALFRLAMRANKPGVNQPSLAELIPTMCYDIVVAREMACTVERYRPLSSETLLLGGDKSRAFLGVALDALEDVLPQVSRVRLERAGHLAPANDGAPERVAVELKRFFGR